MGDLSNRQAAIEYFQRIIDATNTDGRYNLGFIDGLEFCINHLATMPSAQQEIIRCKDCCFYAISKEKRSWCKDMLRRIQPDDYCSRARRREE